MDPFESGLVSTVKIKININMQVQYIYSEVSVMHWTNILEGVGRH
jgi:hypothetical protein